ncbi:hypothetical protein ASD83_08840 [Devosia sp. Root685]|nr:hypothetical protein ASD83_08840 [Devosia sp. Root685]
MWRYIAQHNRQAANGVLRRIHESIMLATENPGIGASRKDISAEARHLVVGSYLVLYEPTEDGILVVAIVHGMTDPKSWLD